MIRNVLTIIFLLVCMAFVPPQEKKGMRVDVVFCVDLSGSTNGLLEDIRDNLWHFVNSVNQADPQADLHIGIVGFSRPKFGAQNDYVSILCDLTDHFDFVSYQLYKLTATVEKGDQMVGTALYTAVSEMSWSKDHEALKIVLLIGNGRVTLGRYDYRKACDQALKNNIIVYPVYCSRLNMDRNDLPGWNYIAEATGGELKTMMVTNRTPLKMISADAEWFMEMNNSLNDTYIYYTKEGAFRYQEMVEADINSTRMNPQFFYARCNYKISSQYQRLCEEWDLVNSLKNNNKVLMEINHSFLPKQLQEIKKEALSEIIKIKAERREKIISRIKIKLEELHADSLAFNPIDSVFYNSIKKHF